MISKKICLIGSFAVGKTSLVRRFVESCFDEKYQTTIGVKIDKKITTVRGKDVQLIIWDLEGRDDFTELNTTYLRGAAGYFLVADSTRKDTFDIALKVHERANAYLGDTPFVFLLSKTDLETQRRVANEEIESLEAKGWITFETSAKTGKNVEEAFIALSDLMINEPQVKAS